MWLLSLLLIVGAALVVIYLIGYDEIQEVKIIPEPKRTAPLKKKPAVPRVQGEIPREKEVPKPAEPSETVTPVEENECVRVERDVAEFFAVLDRKPYIQSFKSGMGTRDHFKRLLKRLSSVPPVPAGEGNDPPIMTKNIFHFFRTLDRKDIRLIREILTRESDTLELNLDMFYQWFMLGPQCPDPEKIRPPLDVSYLYAGFFINTIGGRAYLFRRPTLLRVLVSYYALLIVHEADRKGKNSYGIDIFPLIVPVREELRLFPNLLLKKEYIRELNNLESYYRKKR